MSQRHGGHSQRRARPPVAEMTRVPSWETVWSLLLGRGRALILRPGMCVCSREAAQLEVKKVDSRRAHELRDIEHIS